MTHARNDGVVVAPMTRFAARSFAEEAAMEAAAGRLKDAYYALAAQKARLEEEVVRLRA